MSREAINVAECHLLVCAIADGQRRERHQTGKAAAVLQTTGLMRRRGESNTCSDCLVKVTLL